MWLVLVVVGFGWALLGFAACFTVAAPESSEDAAAGFLSLLVMVLMILPGLGIGGLGLHLRNQNRAKATTATK